MESFKENHAHEQKFGLGSSLKAAFHHTMQDLYINRSTMVSTKCIHEYRPFHAVFLNVDGQSKTSGIPPFELLTNLLIPFVRAVKAPLELSAYTREVSPSMTLNLKFPQLLQKPHQYSSIHDSFALFLQVLKILCFLLLY